MEKLIRIKRSLIPIFAVIAVIFVLSIPVISSAQGIVTLATSGIVNLVGNTWLTVTSLVVTLGGLTLDVSMYVTIHMTDFVKSALPGIEGAWVVIRDFTSIFFIFILLYVSIRTILGSGDSGTVIKLVGQIVLAGIYVNFSLLVVKMIIDAGNILALSLYDAINPADGYGLGGVMMGLVKATTVYNGVQTASLVAEPARLTAMIAGGIILLILGIVLFAGALLMIWRTVSLLGFMVGAPLLAFSFVQIPFLSKTVSGSISSFSSKFLGQVFFAPIFLAVIYVGIKVLEKANLSQAFNNINGSTLASAGTFGKLFSSGTLSVGVLINYIMVIFFFTAALKIGMSLGFFGGDGVVKWANRWTDNIRRYPGQLGGKGLQNTLGRGASVMRDSRWFKNLEAKNPTTVGTWASKGLSSLSKASLGGEKGGYEKSKSERVKQLEEIYKHIGVKGDEKGTIERRSALLAQIKPNSFMGKYINRARQEASGKLGGQLGKEEKKLAKKEAIEENKELESIYNDEKARVDYVTGNHPLSKKYKEKYPDLDSIKSRIGENNKKIAEGRKIEEEEKEEKLSRKLENIESKLEKSGSSGGGGEKKEEKK